MFALILPSTWAILLQVLNIWLSLCVFLRRDVVSSGEGYNSPVMVFRDQGSSKSLPAIYHPTL